MIDTARRRTLGAAGSPSSVVELPGNRRNGTNGAGTFGTTGGRVESARRPRPGDDLADRPLELAGQAGFDIVVSGVCLVLLAPVLLVAAIGVKLTSRGPIIFRQPRVGVGGHVFTMYKFRTYPVDHVDDKFSREHDECPLVWGRFLRRTSIDELPQLLNVLKGDMSLVGPRPERPHFAGPLARTRCPSTSSVTACPAASPARHRCRASGATARSRTGCAARQRLHRGVVVPA